MGRCFKRVVRKTEENKTWREKGANKEQGKSTTAKAVQTKYKAAWAAVTCWIASSIDQQIERGVGRPNEP